MALIKCPECGKEISDKALKCPQCGVQLKEIEMSKRKCQECGAELEIGDTSCSKCGCPVESKEILKENKSMVNSKKILVTLVIVFIIVGLVFCLKYYQKKVDEKAAEEERVKISEDYASNLEVVSLAMLSGASNAEEAGGLIHDVWYNTIFEEADVVTDKYTKGKYGYNVDFDTSLKNLFADSSFQSTISSIESNQENVKSIMKELTNPPEEYNEAYSALKDYYDAYLNLTNIVLNPTGSLQSFTNDFNEADSEVAKRYETMKIYIE